MRALPLLTASLIALAAPVMAADLHVTVPARAVAETVFDWSEERCETWDIPDAPARAWRTGDGMVRLLAAHHRARPLAGPDLDSLGRTCAVAYQGGNGDDPAAHDDMGWIAAPWTTDGRTVHALVHMEWHGHRRPDRCRGTPADCWRNSITYAVSLDGGQRFARPADHLVAVLPPVPTDGGRRGRAGLFNPSNVVTEGACRYVTTFAEAQPGQARGVCLLRNCDGQDPADWRAWDGGDFTTALDGDAACAPVSPDVLGTTLWSITRHEPSGLYIGLTAAVRPVSAGGKPVSGIWALTSPDLIRWGAPHLVYRAPLNTAPDCASDQAVGYPSLIDPDSPSAGFDSTDDTATLYLTRFRVRDCKLTAERDLIRLPVTIHTDPDTPSRRTAGAAPDR